MIEIDICKRLHGASGEMDLEVKLEIKQGAFVALAGESGSGKTTLLRILAGLETVDSGVIRVGDKKWLDAGSKRGINLPPQKRKIGFVFQDYALFPNMSVLGNLLYVRKDKKFAQKLLELVGLSQLQDRLPAALSGGQKQRVSLARAMMGRPEILLLDEPLSALNPELRAKLQQDILSLHEAFGTTTVMVSHDPSEMYRLASRVVVLNHGKVVRNGAAKEVLLHTSGSQKFSFEGELLEIYKVDVLNVGVVSIGNQLVEVVLDSSEASQLRPGDIVSLGTKAFAPLVSKARKKRMKL